MRPSHPSLPFLLVSLAAASTACSSAGQPAEVVRPRPMTAAEALGEPPAPQGPTCRAVAPRAEPLVVDWKMQERTDLELAMKGDRLAIVAHDCKQLKLLKACSAKGSYRFAGVSRKEQVIQVQNQDDLATTIPLGPARLGADLTRGSTIDIGIVLVGKRSTPARDLGRPELVGECDGATHFVRAATVGAFSVGTGTVGSVRAVADLFGAGVNGGSSSKAKELNRDGDMGACKNAKPSDESPPEQCQSAVRLELAPVVAEVKAAEQPKRGEAVDVCPEGTVLSEGVCTAHAHGAFVCSNDNPKQCEEQCDKGNLDSCYRYVNYLLIELWSPNGKPPPNAEQRVKELLERGCAADHAPSCYEIGWAAESALDPSERATQQVAALEKACNLGHGDACWTLGRVLQKGAAVPKDEARALTVARRGCMAGSFLACSDWSAIYESGLGVKKDLGKAREVAEIACDAKEALSCDTVARLDVKAKKFASGVRFMARRCELSPATCALPEGKRSVADDAAGKALLEEICKGGHKGICLWLGRKID